LVVPVGVVAVGVVGVGVVALGAVAVGSVAAVTVAAWPVAALLPELFEDPPHAVSTSAASSASRIPVARSVWVIGVLNSAPFVAVWSPGRAPGKYGGWPPIARSLT
jgi:hypothetical protein